MIIFTIGSLELARLQRRDNIIYLLHLREEKENKQGILQNIFYSMHENSF